MDVNNILPVRDTEVVRDVQGDPALQRPHAHRVVGALMHMCVLLLHDSCISVCRM